MPAMSMITTSALPDERVSTGRGAEGPPKVPFGQQSEAEKPKALSYPQHNPLNLRKSGQLGLALGPEFGSIFTVDS